MRRARASCAWGVPSLGGLTRGREAARVAWIGVIALATMAVLFDTGCRTCGAGTCATNADCEPGFVCDPQGGGCWECLDASDCPAGLICDPTARICAEPPLLDAGPSTPDARSDGGIDSGPAGGDAEAGAVPDGAMDGGPGTDALSSTDAAPGGDAASSFCGNGVLDPPEACDDGNLIPGDGCTACAPDPCGDGALDPAEQCDDGANAGGDGCSATCLVEPGFCFPAAAIDCNEATAGDTTGPPPGPPPPTAIDDYSACGLPFPLVFDGPEYVLSFLAPADEEVHVRLTGLSDDLDLFVIAGGAGGGPGGCVASTCIAASIEAGTLPESIDFTAAAGTIYYLVVDAIGGAGGPFQLAVGCGAEVCTGGIDEDLDLQADCVDQDCWGDLVCLGVCVPSAPSPLACGSPWPGNTGFPGATDGMDTYACAADALVASEYTHAFVAPLDGSVTVTLSGLSADADLVVLADAGGMAGGCGAGATCVGASQTRGATPEAVTFSAVAGATYYLVADGFSATGSASYTIEATCGGVCAPVPPPLSCTAARSGSTSAPAATDANDAWSCAPALPTPGSEIVYAFTPVYDGPVTADLVALFDDVDLFVVTDPGAPAGLVCSSASACAGSSMFEGTVSESVTFSAVGGTTYYLAIDATSAAVTSSFSLSLTCDALCAPAATIGCGEVLSGDTSLPGTPDLADAWPCDPGMTGPEDVYVFTPPGPGPGTATVALSGLSADLDVIVLDAGPGQGCGENAVCLEDVRFGTLAEDVTFATDPTHTYYLVVDGFSAAVSGYALNVSCP